MLHRCLAISSFANFEIFKGMLLIPMALVLPKLDASRVYFLVEGDITNESTQGLVR